MINQTCVLPIIIIQNGFKANLAECSFACAPKKCKMPEYNLRGIEEETFSSKD